MAGLALLGTFLAGCGLVGSVHVTPAGQGDYNVSGTVQVNPPSQASAPVSSPAGSGSASAPVSPSASDSTGSGGFPTVVAQAMELLGARYGAFAEAPTRLPRAEAGGVLAARTFAAADEYAVTLYEADHALPVNSSLASLGSPVGSFSGWSAGSIRSAGDIFRTVDNDDAWVWRPDPVTPLPLTAGIVAHVRYVPGQPASPTVPEQLPTAVITWTEGRWQIVVANMVNGQQPPVGTADQVATYLHTHFLPVPYMQGAIVVTLAPGGPDGAPVVHTTVTWLHWASVYQTATESTGSQDHVLGALRMAVSMTKFPGAGS